jgi:hypothetical protein
MEYRLIFRGGAGSPEMSLIFHCYMSQDRAIEQARKYLHYVNLQHYSEAQLWREPAQSNDDCIWDTSFKSVIQTTD